MNYRRITDWNTSPINQWVTQTKVDNYPTPVTQKSNGDTIAEKFSPKRANKNKTSRHIVFVLDDSASMQGSREATISGFNEFVDAKREDTKMNTTVSLLKFDGTNIAWVHNNVDIAEIKPLTTEDYNPRGMTNLNDGMGSAILMVDNILKAKKKSDREAVTIVILTDGMENSSKTFSSKNIVDMKATAEAKDWSFYFIGSDIDAFAVSKNFGFHTSNTLQYSKAKTSDTFRSLSSSMSRLDSARQSGMNTTASYTSAAFTDAERDESV